MDISFTRGDDHQIKFKFKNFTGTIEKMWFTVKCKNKYVRVQKKLGDGIELIDGKYVVTFVPKDTEGLFCDIEMVYDIQIITGGKKYTVLKGEFILDEDVTTPDCEV